MPTYLADDNVTFLPTKTKFLDDTNTTLDFPTHRDVIDIAADGTQHTRTINTLGKFTTRQANDTFEDSSLSSEHTSDSSNATPTLVNGTKPTDMSSLPNGGAVNGADAYNSELNGTLVGSRKQGGHIHQPMQNGTAVKMPDRAAPLPPQEDNSIIPQTLGATQAIATPKLASSTSNAAQQGHQTAIQPNWEFDGQPEPGNPPTTAPMQSQPANGTTSISADSRPANLQQKLPSSPQSCTVGGGASAGASSLQVPTGNVSKQRHTLEVPRPQQPGRNSKDGQDGAYASGRFSPTTATTAAPRRASLSLARRNTRSLQSELPRDEVVPDEDALRWAEAYRQKRASKRRRREEEDDDRVLVGTKVDEHHANWVTAYNMLTGIRVSVSRTNAKLDRPLTDNDFEAKQKSTFDIAGNELVPSAKYDFKFKDYAPWVFRHLRALFRLDPADYLMSLTGKYILSELGSPGKSGSFFYFSRDYKYIIKTIHHAEHKFLRKVLKDYYQHVTDNPNTLLSQFYGLHRVKMPYGKKIHFVVMNNLFPPHRDIHSTFDLKGSTVGRDYKEEDLSKNPRATLKDLNWLRRQRSLELGIQKKRLFLEQLGRDVALLKKLQIMDYSLLVGIHDLRRGNEENLRGKILQVFNPGGDSTQDESEPQSVLLRTPSKLENARKAKELRQMIRQERPVPMGQTTNQMPDELDEAHNRAGFIFNQDDGGLRATHEDNSPADEIYYLGVIDCLTHYGMIKKIEHFWKGLTNDRTQISALPPDQYGERFFHFVEGITMSLEEMIREKQMRDAEAAAATTQQDDQRVSSWRRSGSRQREGESAGLPHPSPNEPIVSGSKSPEAQETIDKATREAQKTGPLGAAEASVPEKILTTTVGDRRDSGLAAPILPVVEEAAEAHSAGGPSRDGNHEARPITPVDPRASGRLSSSVLGERPPPTPPKDAFKPESQDSGYGTASHDNFKTVTRTRGNSTGIQPRLSKDSLNKDLPPLPDEP